MAISQAAAGLIDFHVSIYNSLLSVEDANANLLSRRFFDRTFRTLQAIFARFDVFSYAGICILHNHSEINPNQIMLQSRRWMAGFGDALVTMPADVTGKASISARPWSFKFGLDQISPLEYSNDPLVVEDFDRLCREAEFLRQLALFLEREQLSSYVGLALFRRKFPAPSRSQICVETVVENMNILHNTDLESVAGKELIKTIYYMGNSELDATTTCVGGKCVSLPSCVKTSVGHSRENAHKKKHLIET